MENKDSKEVTTNNDLWPHAFNKNHFDAPTKCMYCAFFIWGIGKQGFQCKNCNYMVHKKCIGRVPDSCKPGTVATSPKNAVPRIQTQTIAKSDRISTLSSPKKKEASFLIKGKR